MKKAHQLMLIGLSLLPLSSISIAAESKLSLIRDEAQTEKLGKKTQENNSIVSIVEALNEKGLIKKNLRDAMPPIPSVFGGG